MQFRSRYKRWQVIAPIQEALNADDSNELRNEQVNWLADPCTSVNKTAHQI
jgi:hypothetical protein